MNVATHQTALLRLLGTQCLTIAQIAESAALTTVQVSKAASGLVARGLLERKERGCFRLTSRGLAAQSAGCEIKSGPAGVTWRQNRSAAGAGLRQRAWNVMALMSNRTFTVRDLLIVAAKGDESDAEDNLQRFCAVLVRAGYLRRLAGRDRNGLPPTSNGLIQYRVVKHTGPLAPAHRQRKKTLFDHNTRDEVAL